MHECKLKHASPPLDDMYGQCFIGSDTSNQSFPTTEFTDETPTSTVVF